MSDHFLAIWEFHVKLEFVEEFEEVYGPSGPWAALFRTSSGYLGTELIGDVDHARRYLTIDRWTSRETFVHFKRVHFAEYASLDQQCERLTVAEKLIGKFESPTLRAIARSPRL
jgi:heme-degrading monooxygenase HmoA